MFRVDELYTEDQFVRAPFETWMPTAPASAHVERSDQIEGTAATRGPRRPKWHVVRSQSRRYHPADTSVGKRSGYKSIRT